MSEKSILLLVAAILWVGGLHGLPRAEDRHLSGAIALIAAVVSFLSAVI